MADDTAKSATDTSTTLVTLGPSNTPLLNNKYGIVSDAEYKKLPTAEQVVQDAKKIFLATATPPEKYLSVYAQAISKHTTDPDRINTIIGYLLKIGMSVENAKTLRMLVIDPSLLNTDNPKSPLKDQSAAVATTPTPTTTYLLVGAGVVAAYLLYSNYV